MAQSDLIHQTIPHHSSPPATAAEGLLISSVAIMLQETKDPFGLTGIRVMMESAAIERRIGESNPSRANDQDQDWQDRLEYGMEFWVRFGKQIEGSRGIPHNANNREALTSLEKLNWAARELARRNPTARKPQQPSGRPS